MTGFRTSASLAGEMRGQRRLALRPSQHNAQHNNTSQVTKTMMKLALLSLLSLATAVDAATHIAVVEAGVGGAVHRTTSTTPETTVDGAVSFVQAMHNSGNRRVVQHAGMALVPDLFRQADAGIVIGVSSVDFAELPTVSGLLEGEKNGAVGHLEVDGSRCDAILSKVNGGEYENIQDITSLAEEADKSGLSAVKLSMDHSKVSAFDSSVRDLIADIDAKAKKDGKTVVIYLVLEEDAAAARRRAVSSSAGAVDSRRRRLEEVNQYQQNQYNANNGNFFYGYGYFNDYGEWVTPYKTMFQIQYFNVVLWTAIGLTIVLFSTIYLMMFMPLEPDTLLFGESAKMVGDD